MFLMIGITDDRKNLDHDQLAVCELCGHYTRLRVFMTYTVLQLFFIPICKWNRKYFVQSDCCGGVMQLRYEVGERIARGENVEICPGDMQPLNGQRRRKTCAACGYSTTEDFDFCPKCGTKM